MQFRVSLTQSPSQVTLQTSTRGQPHRSPDAADHPSADLSQEEETRRQQQLTLAQLEQRVTGILDLVTQQIQSLDDETHSLAQSLNEKAIELAIKITRRVVGSTKALAMARLQELVRDAMTRSEPPTEILVHPESLKLLEPHLQSQQAAMERFSADPNLKPGECRLRYASYDLESNLDHQLDVIEGLLQETIDESC